MRNLLILFTLTMFIGIVVFQTSAFASSNSGPRASGEGAGAISGWETTNIKYELSDKSSFVKGVSFDLDGAASRVSVKLNSSVTAYTNCTSTTHYHWQCDFPAGVSISSINEFHVVAVGN